MAVACLIFSIPLKNLEVAMILIGEGVEGLQKRER